MANRRRNALHQVSHCLPRDHGRNTIVNLRGNGMLAIRRLAQHRANAPFVELRRHSAYNAKRAALRAV